MGKSGKTKAGKSSKKSKKPKAWGWSAKAFKSKKAKGSKFGIFAKSWWRGRPQANISENNNLHMQKDGVELSEVNIAPAVEETKATAGSRSRATIYLRSFFIVT